MWNRIASFVGAGLMAGGLALVPVMPAQATEVGEVIATPVAKQAVSDWRTLKQDALAAKRSVGNWQTLKQCENSVAAHFHEARICLTAKYGWDPAVDKWHTTQLDWDATAVGSGLSKCDSFMFMQTPAVRNDETSIDSWTLDGTIGGNDWQSVAPANNMNDSNNCHVTKTFSTGDIISKRHLQWYFHWTVRWENGDTTAGAMNFMFVKKYNNGSEDWNCDNDATVCTHTG